MVLGAWHYFLVRVIELETEKARSARSFAIDHWLETFKCTILYALRHH
jgi:hypothetical protein